MSLQPQQEHDVYERTKFNRSFPCNIGQSFPKTLHSESNLKQHRVEVEIAIRARH